MNPVGEGKAARVAGAAVTHAAIRYRNAAKATRKRGEVPLKDEVARARAGIMLSATAAWHPPWLKWRVSLGETHRPDSPIPPAQTRLGGVPGLQEPRFRPEPRKPAPHPGRRDPAAERPQAPLALATTSSHTALQAHRLREAATAPDRE